MSRKEEMLGCERLCRRLHQRYAAAQLIDQESVVKRNRQAKAKYTWKTRAEETSYLHHEPRLAVCLAITFRAVGVQEAAQRLN
jgi:hypothetical protein